MKKLLVLCAAVMLSSGVYAQQSASADQTVNLILNNVIDIAFTSNGLTTGPALDLEFLTINDYVNGVESAPQEIKVRSNKKFTVQVKANSANFSYSGVVTPAPTMPVNGVLSLIVTANGTGGFVHTPFSTVTYYPIRDFNEWLIGDGAAGANQTFSVKYKATPGFAYPAGTYSIDVIYTATQL